MLVKDYMTRHPLMADATMSVAEAQRFMAENNIRHLPVAADGKRLLGLVTRKRLLVDPGRLGSLDVWEIAHALAGLTVSDVMVKARDVTTVDPQATIEEAARAMIEYGVGCLLVLEEDIVTGIITQSDLLAQLSDLLGGRVPGVRATVRVPDRIGEYARLTAAIASQGWGIYAGGTVPSPKDLGFWDVVVKVRNISVAEITAIVQQIEDQELVDVRETRELD